MHDRVDAAVLSVQKFDYPTAFSYWGDEEYAAIQRVIDSKQFTAGPEVAAFEKEFAAYHGKKHAVMVNSGSSANLLIIATMMHLDLIRHGSFAVVPALAWSTTYAPLIQHGLNLILADCDDSWNVNDIEKYVTLPDVGLIVGCSILGNPADLPALSDLGYYHGIPFVEDNCESLGASAGGLCGTFGLMNSFSFFYSHQLSAIEGGMVLTDDEECARTCRMLRAHGWTRDDIPPMCFEDEYDFRAFGYNMRSTEIHAAIAREQLKKQDVFRDQRQENFNYFNQRVIDEDLPIVVQDVSINDANPFGMAFTVNSERARARLVPAFREDGIDCRLPTGGSLRLHKYGESYMNQETPKADHIHRNGLFLGNAPFDITAKIEDAIAVMKKVLA